MFRPLSSLQRTRVNRHRVLNENPIGAWNEYVIVCEGDMLTLVLNGQAVNEVAGVERKSGHVGIIAQGTDVWFRNISLSTIQPEGKGQ